MILCDIYPNELKRDVYESKNGSSLPPQDLTEL